MATRILAAPRKKSGNVIDWPKFFAAKRTVGIRQTSQVAQVDEDVFALMILRGQMVQLQKSIADREARTAERLHGKTLVIG